MSTALGIGTGRGVATALGVATAGGVTLTAAAVAPTWTLALVVRPAALSLPGALASGAAAVEIAGPPLPTDSVPHASRVVNEQKHSNDSDARCNTLDTASDEILIST